MTTDGPIPLTASVLHCRIGEQQCRHLALHDGCSWCHQSPHSIKMVSTDLSGLYELVRTPSWCPLKRNDGET